MAVLVALGVMSVTWMCVIAALVLVQKLLPARAAIDLAVALAIVALGGLILAVPSSVPGLVLPSRVSRERSRRSWHRRLSARVILTPHDSAPRARVR
jgi:predicted metal-binding membrane protein